MLTELTKGFTLLDKNNLTGEEAYTSILNELNSQIAESMKMRAFLQREEVKKSFIVNWTPDTSAFTVEEWGE